MISSLDHGYHFLNELTAKQAVEQASCDFKVYHIGGRGRGNHQWFQHWKAVTAEVELIIELVIEWVNAILHVQYVRCLVGILTITMAITHLTYTSNRSLPSLIHARRKNVKI